MIKPNLNLPLASSINERGIAGTTHTITNSEDQRKINCYYEVSKNALTGAGKVTLTKRPGVTIGFPISGLSSQASYLVSYPIQTFVDGLKNRAWIYSTNGNDVRADSTILFSSATAYTPCFVDTTLLSNLPTIVVQARQLNYTTAHRTFFCQTSTAAFTEIVDADYTGLFHKGKMEHMDGFAFQLESTNKIYNSDLNSLASWNPTNVITKQIKQDIPRGLARLNNQILAFGDETVEMFYNAGNATGSPLSPIKQLHQRIGLQLQIPSGGTHYYAILGNRLYFVGRAGGGNYSNAVYSYNGSGFEKISSNYVDKLLAADASGGNNPDNYGNFYSVNPFVFYGKEAIAINLTSITGSQRWLMYFPEWKDWFEWTSDVFSPTNCGEFFKSATNGKGSTVYYFGSAEKWQDDTTSYTMQTQFSLPQDGPQRKRMSQFGVLADTARASNQLLVEFSDDDYQSFQTVGNIELQRDIKILNRGGSYRQRAVRLSSTTSLETRLHSFIARIE